MLWITLTPKTIVTWENVKKSVQFINNVMSKPNSVTFDEETFFEQFKTFEKIFHQQNDEWHHQDIEDKWLFIFKTFADNNQEFSMLLKVVEFSFVLPGSNAAVERVFSLMNNTWTNSRNKLDIKTVEASLIIKTSFNNTSCEEFYKQILENKSLLRQVHGSAKYLALAKSTEETLESENSEDGSILNESCRNLSVDLIIASLLEQNHPMSVVLANYIAADTIVGTFTTEIKEIYFTRGGAKKCPQGKIYSKYFNKLKSLMSQGFAVSLQLSKVKVNNEKEMLTHVFEESDIEIVTEDEAATLLASLKHGELPWPEIENIWKRTTGYRLKKFKTNFSLKRYLLSFGENRSRLFCSYFL
ncbi:hypothetical protein QTP88_010336 [Uroleucon formosanum]